MPRKREDFVAGGLDSSGFVDGYVSGRGGYDSFAGCQQKLDDCGVGLGASGQEEHFRIRTAYCGTDEGLCAVSVGVDSVAGSLLVVSE